MALYQSFKQRNYNYQSMLELNQKLIEIHANIRRGQINSLMKKLRYEVSRSIEEKDVQELIDTPNQCFNHQHLQTLLKFVNSDHTNAILHLGNLVIDRRVTYDLLQSADFVIGQNQKWIWLIHALSEIAFCTSDMFEYCVRRIIAKKSVFSLQHALQVFHRLLNLSKQYTIDFTKKNPQLLIALCNYTHDAQECISYVALRIISVITSENEQMPQIMIKEVGKKRITKLLLHSLMKLQLQRRILACQIANNFVLSSILLQQVAMRILQLTQVQKESVKLQISYYFRAFVEKVEQNFLFQLIKNHNLLGILREYSLIKCLNPKYEQSIVRNALESMIIIPRRFQEITANLLKKEINRLGVRQMVQALVDESEETNIGI